jgi:TRAP-type C4-dicarboxylate transport system permease small subunit
MRQRVDQFLEISLSILLGAMVLNVLWQVASRYLLNDPSAFTDELSRYMLIWLGLFGAAYASGQNLHVSIDLLRRKLNEQQTQIQNTVIRSVIILFALVMIIGGIRLVYISFYLGQLSSAMQLPLGYVYAALPLSGLLIIFYTLHDFATHKKN